MLVVKDASPAINADSLMARNVALATGVSGPITKNTTSTIIIGSLVVKAIALTAGSDGPITRPLAPSTLVVEPSILMVGIAINAGSLMARNVTLVTGVSGPITKNTAPTIIVGSLVTKATALTHCSNGSTTRPLAPSTLVAEPSIYSLLKNFNYHTKHQKIF